MSCALRLQSWNIRRGALCVLEESILHVHDRHMKQAALGCCPGSVLGGAHLGHISTYLSMSLVSRRRMLFGGRLTAMHRRIAMPCAMPCLRLSELVHLLRICLTEEIIHAATPAFYSQGGGQQLLLCLLPGWARSQHHLKYRLQRHAATTQRGCWQTRVSSPPETPRRRTC